MSSSATDLMYKLEEVPRKGKGLIATRMIPMGTRILSEEPIIRVPEIASGTKAARAYIRKQVDALTPDKRQAFLNMRNIHGGKGDSKYLGIVRTNALPCADGESGILLDVCRINHSCDNNAQKSWNEKSKRHTVYAKRDIEEGEEITIYYLRVLNKRDTRQKALREKFAFTCACHLCSLPPEQSRETDRKLERILELDDLIGRGGATGILSNPLEKLRCVERQIQLYNELGPNYNGLPIAFFDAAHIVVAHGDLARAKIFFKRAILGWTVLEGADGSNVLQHGKYSEDPSKSMLYGLSKKWKTAVDEIPQERDSKQFEDWLWRREKPKQPGQLVDLRNGSTFPGFDGLPHEHEIDTNFYMRIKESTYRPRRHWLFLAEIVDSGAFIRLQMSIKDVDGMIVPLFFHTEQRGAELDPSLIKNGYTVAILYAEFHAFAFSEPGIRLEDSRHIKVRLEYPSRQRLL